MSIFTVFYPYFTRFTPLARLMLSFESTYESNRTYSRIRTINIPADVACGEKLDPEAGTAESGSKGENARKGII